jgi:serine/threonine-protein kinase
LTGPGGPLTAGVDTEFDVSWSTYTGCPSGFDREGYQFTYSNTSPSAGVNPAGPDVNSMTFTVPPAPTTIKISYHVLCGDAGSSPESETLTITVE